MHTLDFTSDSNSDPDLPDAVVSAILGTTITVDRDLGFTPTSSHVVNLIGFADQGIAYAYI